MWWPVRDHSLLKVCSVSTFSKTSTFITDMFVRFQYFQNYLFSKLICFVFLNWYPLHALLGLAMCFGNAALTGSLNERRVHMKWYIALIDNDWGQRDLGSMLKPYSSSTSSAGEDTQTRNSLRVAKVKFLLQSAEKGDLNTSGLARPLYWTLLRHCKRSGGRNKSVRKIIIPVETLTIFCDPTHYECS